MSSSPADLINSLDRDGFALLPGVIPTDALCRWQVSLDEALSTASSGPLSSRDSIYGARNLWQIWPDGHQAIQLDEICGPVQRVLGPEAGLVRALYFDKPPGRSWSLPWHRDLTIAVREHAESLGPYRCPTVKAGVPHVEAPRDLLASMLTLRIHLDPLTPDNGPLVVLPGSHAIKDELAQSPPPADRIHTVLCEAGSVLAMRPLLLHSSIHATEGTSLRRRIVHLEFAAKPHLPAPLDWQMFHPLAAELGPGRDSQPAQP